MSPQFVFAFFDLTPQFGVGIIFSCDFLDFRSFCTAHGGHIFRLFFKILFDPDTTNIENGRPGKITWHLKKTWSLWFFEYLSNIEKSSFSYNLQMMRKKPQKSPILAKICRMIDFDLLNNICSEVKVIASPCWPSNVIPQKLLF